MGLAERRGVKNFREQAYPSWKKRIDDAAGFEVPVEVEWDSLGAEDYSELYDDAFPKVYFEPLVGAIKSVCVDDLGKEALRQGLKKVVIRNTGETKMAFQAGVLTFDHHPVSNLDYGGERMRELTKTLEKGL